MHCSSVDDDSETATEGEDDIKARELRKQEVCLEQPQHISRDSDTGSDTEVKTHKNSVILKQTKKPKKECIVQ